MILFPVIHLKVDHKPIFLKISCSYISCLLVWRRNCWILSPLISGFASSLWNLWNKTFYNVLIIWATWIVLLSTKLLRHTVFDPLPLFGPLSSLFTFTLMLNHTRIHFLVCTRVQRSFSSDKLRTLPLVYNNIKITHDVMLLFFSMLSPHAIQM